VINHAPDEGQQVFKAARYFGQRIAQTPFPIIFHHSSVVAMITVRNKSTVVPWKLHSFNTSTWVVSQLRHEDVIFAIFPIWEGMFLPSKFGIHVTETVPPNHWLFPLLWSCRVIHRVHHMEGLVKEVKSVPLTQRDYRWNFWASA